MLILQRIGQVGRRYPLERSRIVIGRSPDCDVVLDDRQVSRHHAEIRWDGSDYVIEDLSSKNRTHVNGRELTDIHRLEDGDEIQVALRFKLAFVDAEETAPLTFELPQRGLVLNKDTRAVYLADREVTPSLSPSQYRLLVLLADADGAIVDREVIVSAVWPEADEQGVSEQAIDALVRRLRERLAEFDNDHTYILTVRGHGFRFMNRNL